MGARRRKVKECVPRKLLLMIGPSDQQRPEGLDFAGDKIAEGAHALWMIAPPGLEAFFREVRARPGVPVTPRTKQQLNEIARRYATEFR
jgi:hypothetical protein